MSSVTFSGRNLTIKTLNMAEMREVVDEIKGKGNEKTSVLDLNITDLAFNDDVPASAVAKASGLTLSDLEGPVDPQEVKDLIDKVRAANPFFVGMMERLVGAGKAAGKQPQQTSPEPSAS